MHAHAWRPRDCKCQRRVTQTQSHMGSRMELASREDRTTGQTWGSSLTHSVPDCQSLDVFEPLLSHFMHFQISIQCLIIPPFRTSLLVADCPPPSPWITVWGSSSWLRLQVAFPNFSRVMLKWKGQHVSDSGIGALFQPHTQMKNKTFEERKSLQIEIYKLYLKTKSFIFLFLWIFKRNCSLY